MFDSWNQMALWLLQLDNLRSAALARGAYPSCDDGPFLGLSRR
jgi:hypothetical protein